MPFRAKSSTAAKRTEHSRKHSEIFQNSTFEVLNDAADALYRTRNIAAPINAQRFDIKTPCKINGKCVDCSSPDSICNVFATTRHPKPQGRIKVVLIGENFDF